MKQILTTKDFKPSVQFEKAFERYILKLKKNLINFAKDCPILAIHIKKHDKNHFFSELITLRLPKKVLAVNASGKHDDEVIKLGFKKIYREFEKYKAKHFKGYSKYRNHQSIRRYDYYE